MLPKVLGEHIQPTEACLVHGVVFSTESHARLAGIYIDIEIR